MPEAWKLDRFGYPVPDRPLRRDRYGRRSRDADGLSYGQRLTRRRQAALDNRIHPATGKPLLDRDSSDQWGYTCRDCASSFQYRPGNTTVWKCQLAFSSSEATDIRIGWPACTALRINQKED